MSKKLFCSSFCLRYSVTAVLPNKCAGDSTFTPTIVLSDLLPSMLMTQTSSNTKEFKFIKKKKLLCFTLELCVEKDKNNPSTCFSFFVRCFPDLLPDNEMMKMLKVLFVGYQEKSILLCVSKGKGMQGR